MCPNLEISRNATDSGQHVQRGFVCSSTLRSVKTFHWLVHGNQLMCLNMNICLDNSDAKTWGHQLQREPDATFYSWSNGYGAVCGVFSAAIRENVNRQQLTITRRERQREVVCTIAKFKYVPEDIIAANQSLIYCVILRWVSTHYFYLKSCSAKSSYCKKKSLEMWFLFQLVQKLFRTVNSDL